MDGQAHLQSLLPVRQNRFEPAEYHLCPTSYRLGIKLQVVINKFNSIIFSHNMINTRSHIWPGIKYCIKMMPCLPMTLIIFTQCIVSVELNIFMSSGSIRPCFCSSCRSSTAKSWKLGLYSTTESFYWDFNLERGQDRYMS